jgi:hypothetical protein
LPNRGAPASSAASLGSAQQVDGRRVYQERRILIGSGAKTAFVCGRGVLEA